MAQPATALPVAPENPAVIELLAEASRARDAGNVRWAEALARRARCHQPDNVAAAALQCSLLRSLGRMEQALAIGRQFESSGDPGILEELARTLCELERWEDARRITDSLPDAPSALASRIRLACVSDALASES